MADNWVITFAGLEAGVESGLEELLVAIKTIMTIKMITRTLQPPSTFLKPSSDFWIVLIIPSYYIYLSLYPYSNGLK